MSLSDYVNPFKEGDLVTLIDVKGLNHGHTTLGKTYRIEFFTEGESGILAHVKGDKGVIVERYIRRFKLAENTFNNFLANKGYLNTKGVFTLTGKTK